jgi:hypothetical protein
MQIPEMSDNLMTPLSRVLRPKLLHRCKPVPYHNNTSGHSDTSCRSKSPARGLPVCAQRFQKTTHGGHITAQPGQQIGCVRC